MRIGIAAYGIDPAPGIAALAGVALRPVMRLRSQLVNVKQIQAAPASPTDGPGPAEPTTVGLVPLAMAAIPRHASNRAWVGWSGGRVPVRGRICMDQFVVELGAEQVAEPGEDVILFGPGDRGEPTAGEWAAWCDTIGYEIVTRIGARAPRRYLHATRRTSDGAATQRLAAGSGLLRVSQRWRPAGSR